MSLNMSFDHMWLKDVHETVAVKEIKGFEEEWVSEDELLELFYCLNIKRTEDKVKERSIIYHFTSNRLIEKEFRFSSEIHEGEKFKITKEGMEIFEHLYTMVYLGTS